jgi:hypothetical protein
MSTNGNKLFLYLSLFLAIFFLAGCTDTDKSTGISNKTYYSTVIYNSNENTLEIRIFEEDIPKKLRKFGFNAITLLRKNETIRIYDNPGYSTDGDIILTEDSIYRIYTIPNIMMIPDQIVFGRGSGLGDMDLYLDISNLDNIKMISLINGGPVR